MRLSESDRRRLAQARLWADQYEARLRDETETSAIINAIADGNPKQIAAVRRLLGTGFMAGYLAATGAGSDRDD